MLFSSCDARQSFSITTIIKTLCQGFPKTFFYGKGNETHEFVEKVFLRIRESYQQLRGFSLLLLLFVSAFIRYRRKKWMYNETVHQLFIDFKKACDSVRREVLYNILIEFGVPMKLVRLVKMCLIET
jgi:hypothetical protein